jgi:RimJ/RimL family protein N-acetyltransferase
VAFPDRVETERLTLRRFTDDDQDAFAAIWADPCVRAALDPAGALDPAEVPERYARHLAHWREHGFGLWAAYERGDEEVAGWIGATHPGFVPELRDEVEIGWTLRRPYWGRGLATEGAAAAAAAALAHLRPGRLVSLITPANRRSIAVARRLGMRDAGGVRHGERGFELRVYALSAGAGGGPAAAGGAG